MFEFVVVVAVAAFYFDRLLMLWFSTEFFEAESVNVFVNCNSATVVPEMYCF